jgi:V/A-type H+-transporting ATPase subunit K
MDARTIFVKRVALLTLGMIALGLVTSLGTATVLAQTTEPGQQAQNQAEGDGENNEDAAHRWDLSVAIAVAIAVPCLAAGYAVGKVGAAALGAASENPELLTRSLLFVALAEGIAIYGLLVAVLIYMKL